MFIILPMVARLEKVERNLQRLVIEEENSQKDFKEHRSQIEAESARLTNTVDTIKQQQHSISCSSQAFKSSDCPFWYVT